MDSLLDLCFLAWRTVNLNVHMSPGHGVGYTFCHNELVQVLLVLVGQILEVLRQIRAEVDAVVHVDV